MARKIGRINAISKTKEKHKGRGTDYWQAQIEDNKTKVAENKQIIKEKNEKLPIDTYLKGVWEAYTSKTGRHGDPEPIFYDAYLTANPTELYSEGGEVKEAFEDSGEDATYRARRDALLKAANEEFLADREKSLLRKVENGDWTDSTPDSDFSTYLDSLWDARVIALYQTTGLLTAENVTELKADPEGYGGVMGENYSKLRESHEDEVKTAAIGEGKAGTIKDWIKENAEDRAKTKEATDAAYTKAKNEIDLSQEAFTETKKGPHDPDRLQADITEATAKKDEAELEVVRGESEREKLDAAREEKRQLQDEVDAALGDVISSLQDEGVHTATGLIPAREAWKQTVVYEAGARFKDDIEARIALGKYYLHVNYLTELEIWTLTELGYEIITVADRTAADIETDPDDESDYTIYWGRYKALQEKS